jgi:hypothetical protein
MELFFLGVVIGTIGGILMMGLFISGKNEEAIKGID